MRSLNTTPEQLGEQSVRGSVGQQHVTDTVVIEAVPEPVLVAVVHPLGHPDDGLGLRVLRLVLHVAIPLARLAGDQLLELRVELGEVTVGRTSAAVPEIISLVPTKELHSQMVNQHKISICLFRD